MNDDSQITPKTDPPPQLHESRWARLDKKRLAAAFAVAAVSDLLSAFLEFVPPMQWTLDIATALLLFLILGRQWVILPGLIAEAIPGIALFPVWVLVVGSIAVWGTIKPSGSRPS
ncbi:MAG: hypothetical protein EXS18_03150 [Verrucomicrobiae bacterium]|nr:hypothetical protein [Verrucomicrobiae bacterium]